MLKSMVCRYEHFSSDWMVRWQERLGFATPDVPVEDREAHRKLWEWCAIAQVLDERGLLRPGRRGLGFAVGREPLPSLFASAGVRVDATDVGDDHMASVWRSSGEYAGKADELFIERLVDRADFERNVRYFHLDMRDLSVVPRSRYDFVWSACALEYLGSLEDGLLFIERSMELLRRGGVAVHTTEFNVQSNGKTVYTGPSVLYRKRDLRALESRLGRLGYEVEPFDFDSGSHRFDLEYDVPPFCTSGRKHVKLLLEGYVCTSILIIAYR